MATLDDFRSELHQTPPDAPDKVVTLLVDPAEPQNADPVLAAFEDDPLLEVVRVRVGDTLAGYLRRADVLARFAPRRKDAFGWQRSLTIGESRPGAFVFRRFLCTVGDCTAGPVLTLRVDPSDPPRCELHPDAVMQEFRP